jgi:MFS family permease
MLLPLTFGIGIGSLITGQLVTRTGRTAVFPTWGLAGATLGLVAIAFGISHLGISAMPWAFGFVTLCMGSVMAVVQITVQTAAGPRMLGTGAAMVQFSRSVGAAIGTATVAAVLFSYLALVDRQTASLLGTIIDHGPEVLATLAPARQAIIQSEIADAFRAAFATIAIFTGIGVWLAGTLPMRRL